MNWNTGSTYGGAKRQPMSDETLRALAPSVFASHEREGLSSRYSFLPTITTVNALRDNGWLPVFAQEQRTREEGRMGYQKHLIRFQRAGTVATVGEYATELCLINSHDAGSAYQMHAGLFRFVCANGLMVADSTFNRLSFRHVGFDPEQVADASRKLIADVPQIEGAVENFRARHLSPVEAKAFAESAILLKYDSLEESPVRAELLLRPHRTEDSGEDLWRTFNRVQENLVNGG